MEELILERPCVVHELQDEWYPTRVHESEAIHVAAREIFRGRRNIRRPGATRRRNRDLYWYRAQLRNKRPARKFRFAAVNIQGTFNELATRWKRETRHISSVTRTSMHPAYQSIIGMGMPAVPLILRELGEHGGHWFWALRAITRRDPAPEGCDFGEAVHAWLNWGRSQGYI